MLEILAVFGTMIYFRPATMAIDCGADRSCSVAVLSFVADFTFVGVAVDDLVNEFGNGTFFVGRTGVVNDSVEFAFAILFSIC